MKNNNTLSAAGRLASSVDPVRRSLPSRRRQFVHALAGFFVAFGLGLSQAAPADTTLVSLSGAYGNLAADAAAMPDAAVSVPMNKSRVVNLDTPVTRVSVANPDIADILVLNARELYIVGKKLGTTNVVVWGRDKRVRRIVVVQVTHDLSTLKEKLYRYLPGERIAVESAQESIVLSGEVSSVQKMDAALSLAQTFVTLEKAGGDEQKERAAKVLNLMQVGVRNKFCWR